MDRIIFRKHIFCQGRIHRSFGLDTKSGDEILAIFQDLWRQGHTIVAITHNPGISERAQRVIKLIDGRIENNGG